MSKVAVPSIKIVFMLLLLNISVISTVRAEPTEKATTTAVRVQLQNEPEVTYNLPASTRLSALLAEIVPVASTRWSHMRLGSEQLQLQLGRLHDEVLYDLKRLQSHAAKNDQPNLLQAAQQVSGQIKNSQFKASFYFQIPWNSLRLSLESDPQLRTSFATEKKVDDTLIITERAPNPNVHIYGLTQQLSPIAAQPAEKSAQVIKRIHEQQWSPAASNDVIWKIAANGDIAQVPVAYYNAHKPAQCYTHSEKQPLALVSGIPCFVNQQTNPADRYFIGFNENQLPQHLAQLNKKIVRLLKHVGEPSYE